MDEGMRQATTSPPADKGREHEGGQHGTNRAEGGRSTPEGGTKEVRTHSGARPRSHERPRWDCKSD
eukprot:2105183-Alexandrium_andersonii.AAC.1